MEKILKQAYVNPKVELSEREYNQLVELATMTADKIEERARQFYEKEGVAKIQFEGRIATIINGCREIEKYEFDVRPIYVDPTGEYEKTLFFIPKEQRMRIAKKVVDYLEEVFVAKFGERLSHINEIMEAKGKYEKERRQLVVCTICGWLTAALLSLLSVII